MVFLALPTALIRIRLYSNSFLLRGVLMVEVDAPRRRWEQARITPKRIYIEQLLTCFMGRSTAADSEAGAKIPDPIISLTEMSSAWIDR
jgi:hypothetical protein